MLVMRADSAAADTCTPEAIEQLSPKEAEFVSQVTGAARKASIWYPGLPVTVLFDVEYTIGEPDFDHSTNVIARPGFSRAIEELDQNLGPFWDLGICTTRADETLATELLNPTFLAGHTNRIRSTEFLIGSTSRREETDEELYRLRHETPPTERAEALKEIVDPKVLEATLAGELDWDVWYDPKLVLVERLASKHPGRVFILVDDLLAAAAIKPNRQDPNHPKVIGACVNEHRNLRRELIMLDRKRCLEYGASALSAF